MIYYLLIGFIIGIVGINLLAGIGEIITAICDLIKAKITMRIAKTNIKITEYNAQALEDAPIRAIGFGINTKEEEYDD